MSFAEKWKYDKAYKLEEYRLGRSRWQRVSDDVGSMDIGKAYLDVGCGRGESLQMAEQRGIHANGVEMVDALCDNQRVFQMDICDLKFADNAFDYVSCYDVLEHLLPGEEQDALDELGRVCSGVLFLSTNDRPSHLPTGEDLHVNKRPQADWHKDIVDRWGEDNVTYSVFGHGDWHWRITM